MNTEDHNQLEASFQAAEQAKIASKELLRTTIKYKETSEASCTSATSLANQLHSIYTSDWIKQSPHIDVAKYLRYLGTTFNAVNSLNLKMVKGVERDVVEPLQNFTNYDFLEMHDAKKRVTTTGNEYEAMRQKIENAMITQSKKSSKNRRKKDSATSDLTVLVEQYNTELERLREEQEQNEKYLATVLDQTHQKKETKLLKHMLTLVELQYVYHEKACKLLTHLRQKMADLHLQLDESCKEMSGTKEGHLLLKSNSGWQKYWFVLKDGCLNCYRGKKDVAAVEISLNIMYCTTRIPMVAKSQQPTGAVFEVVTPDKKKPLILQADSEEDRASWVAAIQQAIEEQLNQNEPAVTLTENDTLVLKILKSVPGNQVCADCSASNPDWASINLGILLCLECSGVHRNLGTHISKVRSTTLDTKSWEPEVLRFMMKIGNKRFNEIYEANVSMGFTKPSHDAERSIREKYIRAKYADKLFFAGPKRDPQELASILYDTICQEEDNTLEIFKLLVEGADLSWQNPEDEDKTPVHCAVVFDKLIYLEMLILNGGSIFCTETRIWTPMHFAAHYHRAHCAVVLHRHGFAGAKQLECKDWQNKTAIELALVGGCEDIVSVLNGEKKFGVGFTIEDLVAESEQLAAEQSTVEEEDEDPPFPPLPTPPTETHHNPRPIERTPPSTPTHQPPPQESYSHETTPEPAATIDMTPMTRGALIPPPMVPQGGLSSSGEDKKPVIRRSGTATPGKLNIPPGLSERVASFSFGMDKMTPPRKPPAPAPYSPQNHNANSDESSSGMDSPGKYSPADFTRGSPSLRGSRGRGRAPPPVPPKPVF